MKKYLFNYVAYGKSDGLPRHEGEEIVTGDDLEEATNKVVLKLCASADKDLSIRITGIKNLDDVLNGIQYSEIVEYFSNRMVIQMFMNNLLEEYLDLIDQYLISGLGYMEAQRLAYEVTGKKDEALVIWINHITDQSIGKQLPIF